MRVQEGFGLRSSKFEVLIHNLRGISELVPSDSSHAADQAVHLCANSATTPEIQEF